jgi:CheY-like chemotaxis protein
MPVLAGAIDDDPAAGLPDLSGLRVLAAEDNATNRIILGSVLKSLGVSAEIVPSGEALVRRWQEAAFDAVLLDIAMPGRDGVETLHDLLALAGQTGRPLPPALAVTANAMTHQISDYLDRGFAAVVPKPLRAEDLARALSACTSPAGTPA